jgi:hypothetical protein
MEMESVKIHVLIFINRIRIVIFVLARHVDYNLAFICV